MVPVSKTYKAKAFLGNNSTSAGVNGSLFSSTTAGLNAGIGTFGTVTYILGDNSQAIISCGPKDTPTGMAIENCDFPASGYPGYNFNNGGSGTAGAYLYGYEV